MILPHTDASVMVLMLLCLLCWGTWPVLLRLAKRYRFELFYFDFGFGLMLVALICAFTFGSLGFDGFNFTDDLLNSRKQEWLIAIVAAMIFNFGNMLMLSAISVAGIAVAMPIAFGAALIVASWMDFLGQGGLNVVLLVAGTLLILGSIVLSSSGYTHLRVLQHEALARAGRAKSTRRPNSLKGIILALIGGIVMGTFHPLLLRAQDPQDGMGPYALLFLFGVAVVISTFIFNLFFMNLPVDGDPLEIADFFSAAIKNHFLGFMSGVIWAIGALALFVDMTPKGDTHPSGMASMLGYIAPVISALFGLLYFKEFKAGDGRAKALSWAMLVLFAGGWALFAYAVETIKT